MYAVAVYMTHVHLANQGVRCPEYEARPLRGRQLKVEGTNPGKMGRVAGSWPLVMGDQECNESDSESDTTTMMRHPGQTENVEMRESPLPRGETTGLTN